MLEYEDIIEVPYYNNKGEIKKKKLTVLRTFRTHIWIDLPTKNFNENFHQESDIVVSCIDEKRARYFKASDVEKV